MVTFIANCSQRAADIDMVKILQRSGRAAIFASLDNFPVKHIINSDCQTDCQTDRQTDRWLYKCNHQ